MTPAAAHPHDQLAMVGGMLPLFLALGPGRRCAGHGPAPPWWRHPLLPPMLTWWYPGLLRHHGDLPLEPDLGPDQRRIGQGGGPARIAWRRPMGISSRPRCAAGRVRDFCRTPVPEELLRRLPRGGRLAPQQATCSPWEFVLIRDPKAGPRPKPHLPASTPPKTAPLLIARGGPQGHLAAEPRTELLRIHASRGPLRPSIGKYYRSSSPSSTPRAPSASVGHLKRGISPPGLPLPADALRCRAGRKSASWSKRPRPWPPRA